MIINKNSVDNKLKSMAITINDPKNKEARKNDCYTYVCHYIINNKVNNDDKIVFYSLGNSLGHCILVDKDNKILSDNFFENLSFYDQRTREIKYSGYGELGENYKLFYEINIEDYKNKYLENYKKFLSNNKNFTKKEKIKKIENINYDDDIKIDYSNIHKTIGELIEEYNNKNKDKNYIQNKNKK